MVLYMRVPKFPIFAVLQWQTDITAVNFCQLTVMPKLVTREMRKLDALKLVNMMQQKFLQHFDLVLAMQYNK